jgi:hypothetical protein
MLQTEINKKISSIDEDTLHEMHFTLDMFKSLEIDLTKDLDKVIKACEKYSTY